MKNAKRNPAIDLPGETWQAVEDGLYMVSNLGRFKRAATGVLQNRSRKSNTPPLFVSGKFGRALKLKDLVHTTFIGPIPDGYRVYHKNDDPYDCSASNLGLKAKLEVSRKIGHRPNGEEVQTAGYVVNPEQTDEVWMPVMMPKLIEAQERGRSTGLIIELMASNLGRFVFRQDGGPWHLCKVSMMSGRPCLIAHTPYGHIRLRAKNAVVSAFYDFSETSLTMAEIAKTAIQSKNNDDLDLRLCNLEILQTAERNHKIVRGRYVKPADIPKKQDSASDLNEHDVVGYKLNEKSASIIYLLVLAGFTYQDAGQAFGVSRETVRQIWRGVTWAHLKTKYEHVKIPTQVLIDFIRNWQAEHDQNA